MSDNILIDVSTTIENVNVEVVEASATSIGIEYFYPQGPIGPTGPTGPAGSSLWGTISGTLSAQTDLWRYLSAVGTSNFDIVTLNNYLSTTPVLLSSLNVKGTILSAGIPLHNIFLTSETDSQTLFYVPSSYLLSISNGNTINLSSINSTFASNSGKYESVFTTVQSNSGNWQNAYDAGTVYQSNSSSYATTSYVNNNFFPLSGGTITGSTRINNNLTVFGNLTATGTTTFANTVFSVTSALSVVHIGSGPALYVGNNGDGDIASFYDIDQNIEILHVGGINSSFPNVGVKVSSPNKDFTVNGEISANNTIYDAIGNSNQWNQAYNTGTTYQGASSSFATNTTLNSVSSLLTPLTLTNTLTGQLLLASTYQNASGNFILDGGNTKATNITIGTNDNFNLNFETANTTKMVITSTGAIKINEDNGDRDFQIGSQTVDFLIGTDASTSRVCINHPTNAPAGTLDIRATNGTPALVVNANNANNCSWQLGSSVTDFLLFGESNNSRVGINTSSPNKDFTVNGEISANNTIYDAIGNSTLWNRAYNVATIVQANSASWEESADILPTVTNYLSTSNILISSLNVLGNLSATGTIQASSVISRIPLVFTTLSAYTLSLADQSDLITINNSLTSFVYIPNDSSVNFGDGSQINISRLGSGTVTISALDGVVLRSADNRNQLRTQNSTATIVKLSANDWLLFGDIS